MRCDQNAEAVALAGAAREAVEFLAGAARVEAFCFAGAASEVAFFSGVPETWAFWLAF